MLRAGALIYAVYISLLIGALCYGLFLIHALNTEIEVYSQEKNLLLMYNRSAESFVLASGKMKAFPEEIPHTNSIISSVSIKPWGLLNTMTVTTSNKKDSISQTFLVGEKVHKNSPALYVRNNDEDFKISGSTVINGDIYVSDRGIKKISIEGNRTHNNPHHNGRIHVSDKHFSKFLTEEHPVLPKSYKYFSVEEIKDGKLVNSFQSETLLMEVSTIIENVNIKGNVFIFSKDTLEIASDAVLNDVIIKAPKIVISEGFEGAVQIIAEKEIIVKSNTNFLFPSVIMVNSSEDGENIIFIDNNVTINGILCINGNGLKDESKNKVVFSKNSLLTGSVYCNGSFSMYGEVRGSVYASSVEHSSETTHYKNLLFDIRIDREKLPEGFFQLGIIEKFNTSTLTILKKV